VYSHLATDPGVDVKKKAEFCYLWDETKGALLFVATVAI
jgi:hypothetical protein